MNKRFDELANTLSHSGVWRAIIPFLLLVLPAVLGLGLAEQVKAQTFNVLHSFNGSDGGNSYAGLILSGETLYGTTYGTVFNVNIDGTGFTTLHGFAGYPTDGTYVAANLILLGNTLYGTASAGGSFNQGTLFKVNTDGTDFTNFYTFSQVAFGGVNSDGAGPQAGLVSSGDTLYGTASHGGNSAYGTVFKLNTDGTGFTTLHSFTSGPCCPLVNSDGGSPSAGLVLSGTNLYGTAYFGGNSGNGTLFKLNTDGTGFTVLHAFTPLYLSVEVNKWTNSDGANPQAGLILSSNTLYGTSYSGGSFGIGTVFKVNIDGTGFTTLHNFHYPPEGGLPFAGLVLLGNTLFGTTVSGYGTVFKVNTDGTDFATLHEFNFGDGVNPYGGLIVSSNALYGTTEYGGPGGYGTVFSLSFTPQLTITPAGSNVILTWPTNYAGFDYSGYTLQSTTTLAPPIWTTNLPAPVVINGQNTVTNLMSGNQQYFRLSQ